MNADLANRNRLLQGDTSKPAPSTRAGGNTIS
jgi:hypothetical protein